MYGEEGNIIVEFQSRESEARKSLKWYGTKKQRPYQIKPETWERILYCGWLHRYFPDVYDVTFGSGNDIYLDWLENKATRKRWGNIYKSAGMKKGVPDLITLWPSKFYHGCLIEMKREHGGRITDDQKKMIELFRHQHYYVQVCHGFPNAAKAMLRYLFDYN